MDWTKAKNILIVALLVTNLVLAGAILYDQHKETVEQSAFLEATIEILEDRNIYVDVAIPTDQVSMPVLSVEYDNPDKMLIKQNLAQAKALPLSSDSDDDLVAMTDEFLVQCNIMNDHVQFDKILKSGSKRTVVYKNVIDGIAIEDSYIKCFVENGKIVDLKRLWLEPVGFGKTKKEVIPVAEALVWLMSDNQEYDEIHVEKLELVYWLDTSAFDLESPVADTAFPAWKITYNNGKIKHVNAFQQ